MVRKVCTLRWKSRWRFLCVRAENTRGNHSQQTNEQQNNHSAPRLCSLAQRAVSCSTSNVTLSRSSAPRFRTSVFCCCLCCCAHDPPELRKKKRKRKRFFAPNGVKHTSNIKLTQGGGISVARRGVVSFGSVSGWKRDATHETRE